MRSYSFNLFKISFLISLLLSTIFLFFQVHASSACDPILLSPPVKHLNVKPDAQSIAWGSSVILFSPNQFQALLVLLENAPNFVHNDKLAKLVWSSDGATSDDIRTLMVRIKRKFLEIDPQFDLIRNKYGRGYSWSEGESAEIGHELGPFTLYQATGHVRCRDKVLELSPWEADVLNILSGQPLRPHPYWSFTQTSESSRNALITFKSKVSKLNAKFHTRFNLTQRIIKSKQSGYYILDLGTQSDCI